MEIRGIWFDGISGQIRQGDLVASISATPGIPGVEFDQIIYDPAVGTFFKVVAAKQLPLTEEEKNACAAYIETFMEQADYPVFAWDEAGVCLGQMARKEAEAKGVEYTVKEIPPHPACKWTGSGWAKIKAAITDTGTLKLDPEGVCGRCVVVLTAGEWAAHPQPDMAKPWLKWDFASETWEDKRSLADELYTTRLDMVSRFEHLKVVRFGRTVTEDELRLWDSLKQGDITAVAAAPLDTSAYVARAKADQERYRAVSTATLMERETWLACMDAVSSLAGLDAMRAAFEGFFSEANALDKAV